MNEHDGKCGNFWLGFFLGGLLGAFVIYLLGTKEGKKTLEKIVDRAELYEEELEEKVAKLQQKGEDLLEEAEEIKEKVIQEVTSSKEKISDQLVSKMDAALTHI